MKFMQIMGIVQGSVQQAQPLVVGFDTVYVHTDIKPLLDEQGQETGLYEYQEVQYGLDEYQILMSQQKLENLEEQQIVTFEAMAQQYEEGLQRELNNMEIQATIYEAVLSLGTAPNGEADLEV